MTLPRHTRQIMLPEIGGPGQARLEGATVALVGAGGLGGPAAMYLASAGMGRIRLVDFDAVEDSNLQRQVQFTEADIGLSKVERLRERLLAMDGRLVVEAVEARLTEDTAEELLAGSDVVLDGCDSFETRFAVNAACRAMGVPLVSGAIARWSAQVGVFAGEPCYRCFVADVPPDAETCEAVGIVGAVAGVAGSLMALEAVKIITGAGENLRGKLWLFDGLVGEGRTVSIAADPECPVCGRQGG